MSYRYLLVPATGTVADAPVFATALTLARLFAAHLEFLHVRPDVAGVMVSLSAGGIGGGSVVQGVVDRLEGQAHSAEAAARTAVARFCSDNAIAFESSGAKGVSAAFTVALGNAGQSIVDYGRFADLVVLGRGEAGREAASEMLQAALMETGRPLLIAAPTPPSELPGTVIIAWKDTPEAARAVAAAMPLLERARRVLVVTVGVAGDGREASAERVRRALLWHNPAVELRALDRRRRRPFDVLLEEVAQQKANLLVMGGYSHSRLHEVMFGGFTSQVLAGIDLPVLMAH